MLLRPFQFIPAVSPGIELLYLLLKAMLGALNHPLTNCFAALCAFDSTQVGPLLSSGAFWFSRGHRFMHRDRGFVFRWSMMGERVVLLVLKYSPNIALARAVGGS